MLDSDGPLLIQAHRGYSGLYPENTLLAFEKAVIAGSDVIEFDIHLSKDKKLFVIHDESVDRTTDCKGEVYSMTSEQLRQLDAGRWFDPSFAGERIPTLPETLDLLKEKDVVGNIEIKTDLTGYEKWREMLNYAVEVIDRKEMWEQVIFTSFDLRAIKAVLQLRPYAFTALIDWRSTGASSRQVLIDEFGASGWFGSSSILTEELVESAHQKNLKVISGGGKELQSLSDDVTKLLELGVEGISTDYPQRVKEAISEYSEMAGK